MNIHWHLYSQPAVCTNVEQVEILKFGNAGQIMLKRVDVELKSQLFQLSFEQLFEKLEKEPALHVEMDGAFWWTGPQAAWQMDGQLYDRGPHLQRLQLKGSFPQEAWQRLLGWIAEPCIVHDIDLGMFFKAEEFTKRW